MRTLAFVSVLLVAACHGGSSVPPVKSWSVSNGFIRDEYGRAVTLRGMQVAGDQKSAPYINNFTLADYQRMRDDWGFNSMRFLMVWAAIEPQEGQYDDAYLDALATRISWAQQLGLSVVLDMHQDIYGEGFGFDGAPKWACPASEYAAFKPVTPWSLNSLSPQVEACVDLFYTDANTVAHFTEAWRRVAQKLAGNSAVIGFDILNEPPWGSYDVMSFEHDRLQPFYDGIIRVVRGEAPHWLVFTEPASSRNLGTPTGLGPFPFDNIVYAPHSYDSVAEVEQSFPPSDRDGVISNVDALQHEAKYLNAALWVGEYGGQWSDPNIDAYMDAEYAGIGAVAGGSSYWSYDFGGGYAPVDANGMEHPALIKAIVRPYPSRTAGTPISYAFDEMTSTFTLTYTPDTTITAPTEIIVPSRVYPNGFQVDCGGCTFQKTSTGVNVTAPGLGSTTMTVVLSSQ